KYDGKHKWVPFLGDRLKQGESIRKMAVDTIRKSGLCAGDDGYWEWLVGFNQLVKKNEERIHTIRAILMFQKAQVQQLHKWWPALWRVDQENVGGCAPKAKEDDILDFVHAKKQLSLAGLNMLRETRAKIAAGLRQIAADQDKLFAEAQRLMAEVIRSAEGQAKKSGRRRRSLESAIFMRKFRRQLTTLELYEMAGRYDKLERALKGVKLETAETATAKLMSAKLHLARAGNEELTMLQGQGCMPDTPIESPGRREKIEAMFDLRQALRMEPDNVEAKLMLRDLEVEVLRWIAQKLEREKKLSWGVLRQYLEERGYDPEDPEGYWDGFKEYVYAFFAIGPVGTISGFVGKPGARAEEASIIQESVAKHHVSLMAILRLRRSGVPLHKIRRIVAKELSEEFARHGKPGYAGTGPGPSATAIALPAAEMPKHSIGEGIVPLYTVAGKPLNIKKAQRLAQDIKETFAELEDLRRLAEWTQQEWEKGHGEKSDFLKALAKSYYRPTDVESTWPEYLGDFFSTRHLLTVFAPFSIARIGGKAQWFRLADPKTLEITRGSDIYFNFFANRLRLANLAESFTTKFPRLAGAMQQAILADQRFMGSLGTAGKVFYGGTKLVSAVVLYAGVHHLAGQSPVAPGALQLLVEAFAELGGGEVAFQLLARAGISPSRALAKVIQLEEILKDQQKVVVKRGEEIKFLADLIEKRKTNQVRSAADEDALEDMFKKYRGRRRESYLGDDLEEDLQDAMFGALSAYRAGDIEEAARILGPLNRFVKNELEHLEKSAIRIAAVRARFADNPNPMTREFEASTAHVIPETVDTPSPFRPEGGYWEHKHLSGFDLKKGDEAFRKGDFELAIHHYQRGRNWAQADGLEDHTAFLNGRIDFAEAARDVRKAAIKARKKAPSVFNEDIDEDFAKGLSDKVNQGKVKITKEIQTGKVYELTDEDGVKYVFKKAHADEMEAEEVAALLADELNFRVPRVKRAKLPVGPGQLDEEGVLMRHIEGKDMTGVEQSVLVALKDEYAQQRVFSLWLGDADRHLGNGFFGQDKKLWLIDSGLAHLQGLHVPHRLTTKTYSSSKEFMEDMVSFADEAINFLKKPEVRQKLAPDVWALRNKTYRWMKRIEEMLHYDQMKDTIEAIKKFAADTGPNGLEKKLEEAVKKQVLTKQRAGEILRLLRDRAGPLDDVLKQKFSLRLELKKRYYASAQQVAQNWRIAA
ncbi:MAG: hypothetical protein ACE5JS_10210, partial [Nitrospinota bacterium]